MRNRQMDTLNDGFVDLLRFFDEPTSERQKQYEAVRSLVKDKLSAVAVAERFSYSISTVYSLVRDARAGKLQLFPEVKKGPAQRKTLEAFQKRIVQLRNENLASPDIQKRLSSQGIEISTKTIERILKDSGFQKLSRRNHQELGLTKNSKAIPVRAENLDFNKLEPFNLDCPIAGVFCLLPYISTVPFLMFVRTLFTTHQEF